WYLPTSAPPFHCGISRVSSYWTLLDFSLQLLHLREKDLDVQRLRIGNRDAPRILHDDAVGNVNAVLGVDVLVVLEDAVIPLGQAGEDLDRFVAEQIGVLHNTAENLAGLNALERLEVLVKGDDGRLGLG